MALLIEVRTPLMVNINDLITKRCLNGVHGPIMMEPKITIPGVNMDAYTYFNMKYKHVLICNCNYSSNINPDFIVTDDPSIRGANIIHIDKPTTNKELFQIIDELRMERYGLDETQLLLLRNYKMLHLLTKLDQAYNNSLIMGMYSTC